MQQEALWNSLRNANSKGETARFQQLCRDNSRLIENIFPEWRVVPEHIRNDKNAVNDYGQTLIGIATFFATVLKRSGPIDLITGKNENTLFDEFDNLIRDIDILITEGRLVHAVNNIQSYLASISEHQGNGLEPIKAICFGRLGQCYYELGQIEYALNYNNYALGACYRAGDVPGVFNYFANLHFIYEKENRLEEAEEWALGAFNFAVDNGLSSKALLWELSAAELQLSLSKLEVAKETLNSALRRSEKIESGEASQISTLMNNSAEFLRNNGSYKEAEPLYLRAIDIRRQFGLNDTILGQLLHNLGYLYLQYNLFEKAKPVIDESIKIFKSLLPDGDVKIAQALHNLAAYHQKVGEITEARKKYDESLEQKRINPELNEQDFESSFSNLVDLEIKAGRDFAAKAFLDQLNDKNTDIGRIIDRTFNQIKIYNRMGNFTKAEAMLYEFRTFMLSNNRASEEILRIDLELAGVKGELGKYDEAEQIFVKSIAQIRKGGNWLPEDLPTALNNLGLLYLERYKYPLAEEMLSEALDIRTTSLTDEHPSYLATINNLALVYHHTKKLELAEQMYRKVLNTRKKILYENHPDIAQSQFNLGMILLAKGDYEQGLDLLDEQFRLEDNALDEVFGVSSEQERLAYVANLRTNLDVYLLMIMNDLADNDRAINLAFDVVLRRKGIVIDALKSDYQRVHVGKIPGVEPIFKELNQVRTRIAKEILSSTDQLPRDEQIKLINQLQEERNLLETSLSRKLELKTSDLSSKKADRCLIAETLGEESILIEFLKWDLIGSGSYKGNQSNTSAYSAFVLFGSKPDHVKLFHLGLADTTENSMGLEPAIEAYREAIEYPHLAEAVKQQKRLGVALREILIDRVMEDSGERKRVYISPDGVLNNLPFESLPLGDFGYLCDQLTISYLSSGRELQRNVASKNHSSKSVVIANPSFDLNGTKEPGIETKRIAVNFKPLTDAKEEGEWIADAINANIYQGDAALESIIKGLNSPRVLHLATHGFFLNENFPNPMLKSGIALAGANNWVSGITLPEAAEDGLLMAEDVCGMNLWGTDLVVLSACESGLGDYKSGEGVFGLRRAFELAGARSLVISLWKVPSEPTKLLMKEFYRQLLAGKNKVDSLQSAKAILRRRFSDPLYWAGFVLSGEAKSIY